MKRVFVCCLVFCMLACVPTPDEDFVAQKEMTQMIELAKATPIPESTVLQMPEPETAPVEPENRVRASLPGKTTEHFRVEVDAAVSRPDGALPIVRVTADDFDTETANRFYRVLTDGFDMYTPEQLLSAPVLDRKIQEAMDEIANGNDEQPMKDYLNELMKQRKTAPDTSGEPVEQIDLQKHEVLYSLNEQQIFSVSGNSVKSDGQAEKEATVFFRNSAISKDYASEYRAYFGDAQCATESAAAELGLSMTPTEAEAYASTLLNRLGLDDLAVTEIFVHRAEDDAPLYIALCDRTVDGVAVAHPAINSGSREGTTAPTWGYEQAIACFNDAGLAYFGYTSPLSVEDTVVEQANLLPFERIMERFESMIAAKYEVRVTDSSWGITDLSIYVTDITLSLQRINEQDTIDYGLLVPVWNFWGYRVQTSAYEPDPQEEAHIDGWHGSEPLLSINAVDATVIDPSDGY